MVYGRGVLSHIVCIDDLDWRKLGLVEADYHYIGAACYADDIVLLTAFMLQTCTDFAECQFNSQRVLQVFVF